MISNQTVQLIFFRLHLMLYARIVRFDVMAAVALFENLVLELNVATVFEVWLVSPTSFHNL